MHDRKFSDLDGAERAEQISGLIDGELDPAQARQLIAAICEDDAARQAWVRLHLVGDALRSSEVAGCHSERFCSRVSAALRQEATVLAPRPTRPSTVKRYLIPGLALAASVAAISLVALPLLSPGVPPPGTNVVATGQSMLTAEEAARRAALTVANARALDPYLAAHRELTAGGVALPRATPYLRPAVDPGTGR